MPRRTRPERKDSSQSLRSLSPNDIPWFCNFGKFVGNANFLLSTPPTSAKTVQPCGGHQKRFFNTEDARDTGVLHVNEARVNLITSFEENEKRTDRLLRANRGPRIVSEVPIPTSKNAYFLQEQDKRNVFNTKQIDGTDDLAPSSLGSMLRRMVSFDNHEQGRNDSSSDGYTGFSHTHKESKRQEAHSNAIDSIISSFDEKYPSCINPNRSEETASHSRNSPAKDSRFQNNVDHYLYSKGRRRRHWRQTSKLGEVSSRNLGAVIRRMISFEKTS